MTSCLKYIVFLLTLLLATLTWHEKSADVEPEIEVVESLLSETSDDFKVDDGYVQRDAFLAEIVSLPSHCRLSSNHNDTLQFFRYFKGKCFYPNSYTKCSLSKSVVSDVLAQKRMNGYYIYFMRKLLI